MIAFSQADLTKLAGIIKELTGNQILEKNYSMVQGRMRYHLGKLGIASAEDYWKHYAKNEIKERQVLLSLMTTHHTFFFREYIHFEQLERWIEENARRLKRRYQQTGKPVTVWSAACSRGQEAYSFGMFLDTHLKEAHGIPFKITASDIDEESVKYGENGVYPIKEVNTIPQHYLAKFWRKGTGQVKDFAAVKPSLRRDISFATANLLKVNQTPFKDNFDVIFARNVFIYFSQQDVEKIALDLAERLLPGGYMASGVSEPLRFESWKLTSVGPSSYVKALPPDEAFSIASSRNSENSASSAHGDTEPRPKPTQTSVDSYRALVIDDSKTIHLLMKKIFATDPNCTEIVPAMNGEEARKILENHPAGYFGMITLDIHMPVMGGIEFLERVYKKDQHPPVIIVSSVDRRDADLATRALQLGAFDFVQKPAMNGIAKSAEEIITKGRMARRNRGAGPELSFNEQNSRSIVVPNASSCLRWLAMSGEDLGMVRDIARLVMAESRSPATIVSVDGPRVDTVYSMLKSIESKVEILTEPCQFLRPNTFYVIERSLQEVILRGLTTKMCSLQIFDDNCQSLGKFSEFENIQILADEGVSSHTLDAIINSGLTVSDVTPYTSFVSLSLEFFANLRKASAA